jgi:hypothetical protein
MTAHHFAINVRSDTTSEAFREALRPWGYLLPGNAPRSVQQRALELTADGVEILADNGHFDDIGRIASIFRDEAQGLLDEVGQHEAELGRDVRPGELSDDLCGRYRDLAAKARAEAQAAIADRNGALAAQRAFLPTRLIGAEDITMALWLALNIEPAYLHLRGRDYARMNEAVARTAVRELVELDPEVADGYYPVASAVDYNTAEDAGEIFAAAGLQRAAMGFGAYMADDNYSDYVIIGRRRIDLNATMPNRYLRTALVARGFWDGYRAVAGWAPRAFHFLGLGAPIMLGPAALAAWDTPLLTFDATSPIRDAVEGTIYLSAPAPLKVRTRRLALQLAERSREEWNCPCPFCGPFVAAHPFDYPAGHAWHAENLGEEPTADDLRPGGRLFAAYPLLSEPAAGDELRTEVNVARMGHNHWALIKITRGLNASSSDRGRLAAYVAGLVDRYEQATTAPHFAQAVRFAYDLAMGAFTI